MPNDWGAFIYPLELAKNLAQGFIPLLERLFREEVGHQVEDRAAPSPSCSA
jgi:hypothetical protein